MLGSRRFRYDEPSTATDNGASAHDKFHLMSGSDTLWVYSRSYLLTFTLWQSMTYELILFGGAGQDKNPSAAAVITTTFRGGDVAYQEIFRGLDR